MMAIDLHCLDRQVTRSLLLPMTIGIRQIPSLFRMAKYHRWKYQPAAEPAEQLSLKQQSELAPSSVRQSCMALRDEVLQ